MRPYMKTSAAGMISTSSISKKLVNCVGFSNGCAELVLKKPPPFVPSSLIASCEATGPIAIDLRQARDRVRRQVGRRSCAITPWETSTIATITDSGAST